MTDQAPAKIHLSLTGAGVTVEKDIDESLAAAIINIVMGGAAIPVTSPRDGATGVQTHHRPITERLSLREYLDDVGAVRYPDKIVAIGRYMTDHEQRDTFTRDDIKSRFKSAGEAQPGNFARDFSVTLKSGWIAEDNAASGTFYVTKKGTDVIAGGFAAELRKGAKSRRTKRSSQPDRIEED